MQNSMPVILVEPPHPWLLPVLIFLIIVELGVVLAKRIFCRDTAEEVKALTLRKVDVMMQMKKLGIPTDFVKKSKLERELIHLDKELAPRKEQLVKQAAEYDAFSSKLKYGVYILLIVGFWNTPLLKMTPSATWPLTSFFAFPRLGAGCIGVSAAIAMVKAVITPVLPWLASV